MSTTQSTQILVLGATGYIGGTVLARLLANEPTSTEIRITVLVRSQEKAEKFNSISAYKNLTAVVGGMDELNKLEELAQKADYVFNFADADNVNAAKAILSGLKKRYDNTGAKPVLIHTSGTGVVTDDVAGMLPTDRIYSDLDIEMIESIPPTAPHREVDLAIVDASQKGCVRTFIVLPSTIYGIVSTPFTSAALKVQNNHSVQIPALIRASVARGQGGVIGEGKNMWGNVHIDEVADLYLLIFNAIVSGSDLAEGRDGFYFGSSDEHELLSLSKTISKVLFDMGKSKSPEPTSFTEEEVQTYLGGLGLGSNSRCRSDRSGQLGWKPKKRTEDMLASIQHEVVAFLKGYESD